MKSIAEVEIGRITWDDLRSAGGFASTIPKALADLYGASTPEQAQDAYWRLENHVVVQGQLYQAAEQVVSVLLAMLSEERPRHVRISSLELLLQILMGEPHTQELSLGNANLAERCRNKAKEGLWTLYKELHQGEREAAREILDVIEDCRGRLSCFDQAVP